MSPPMNVKYLDRIALIIHILQDLSSQMHVDEVVPSGAGGRAA